MYRSATLKGCNSDYKNVKKCKLIGEYFTPLLFTPPPNWYSTNSHSVNKFPLIFFPVALFNVESSEKKKNRNMFVHLVFLFALKLRFPASVPISHTIRGRYGPAMLTVYKWFENRYKKLEGQTGSTFSQCMLWVNSQISEI